MKKLGRHKRKLREFSAKKRQTFRFWGFKEVKNIISADEYKEALGKYLGDATVDIPEKLRVHYFGLKDILVFTPVGE